MWFILGKNPRIGQFVFQNEHKKQNQKKLENILPRSKKLTFERSLLSDDNSCYQRALFVIT
jgi:hypothetical protein